MLELDCDDCSNRTMQGLRALQHEVLERLARGKPLRETMAELCLRAEQLAPQAVCSVLTVDREGRLHPLAGPSLPSHYSDSLDGLRIGPDVGSCGAAAYFGEPVEVTDMANDPRWTAFRAQTAPLGLRACWSSPIRASDDRVIGTFAFYYRTCRGASPLERTIVETCVHLCAIALEQEERKERIRRLAYFDAITGVANRASMEQQGESVIAAAVANGFGAAIHCIDLDNFKEINDTLGHRAGDILLRSVAERISSIVGKADIVARIGGDEFAVVQSHAGSLADVGGFAMRLMEAMAAPFDLEEAMATVGVSVGIARAPEDGLDLRTLMRKADFALYEAKSSGRAHFRFFDPDIESRIAANRRIWQDLRQAVAAGEFELHFQPIVALGVTRVCGYEALLRWRHPRDGLRTPEDFLPVATKAGLLYEIGAWILNEACASAAALPPDARISVNVTQTQLEKTGFSRDVAEALAASGMDPSRLEIEIASSVRLADNADILRCLTAIHTLGVSIALDDFGGGGAALAHLHALPVDRVKVGRSLTQQAQADPRAATIVRSIVSLAHELGLMATAEGVETDAQLRILRQLGCDEIQGYVISAPQPLRAFVDGAEPAGRTRPPVSLT
ncbi:diguanylate cyclase (GGDEF)-like protein [Methylosinus sp. sav-2]|jgi:diguanylate cyclase (GGDEF)-like protein|uniref:putative bifunctional diguanylate cyclase/phosphodiesterase n=1 Tax=unclassified Methylosinus TaxID=2624500 RepID=UPI0004AC84AC|nr:MULTISPECIES: EAL domain-containing protein [unclassified Methylosinus]TDX62107.1 diguanylate cyclase (GGDEF)-like protein [Methylosinus sp. sav-2]